MNAKQIAAKNSKMTQQRLDWRKKFWPEVDENGLWDRKDRTRCNGFTTMPRTMPNIMGIIDSLTKGKPSSPTYLVLWCRVTDEMVIRIQNPIYLAAESGFSHQRQVTTWENRMKSLVELGFIKATAGQAGPYEFVLVMNPYLVIYALHEKEQIPVSLYNALQLRAMEIGAKDLEIAEKKEEAAAGLE